MARPPLSVDVTSKDQKELRVLLSGGVQQVRVVLRALTLLQLANGVSATDRGRDPNDSASDSQGWSPL
jgi:hypothetical protein